MSCGAALELKEKFGLAAGTQNGALVLSIPAAIALPALNPNHPNQKIPVPIRVMGKLWASPC